MSNQILAALGFVCILTCMIHASGAQPQAALQGAAGAKLIPIAPGWAGNSVNTVIFRRDPITTHGDTQYAAFYDQQGNVVLGKRKLGTTQWETRITQHEGNHRDAHNTICIAVDGAGILHIAWDHHNNPLRYARSTAPGSLELTDKMPMTGERERSVTYPEFYNLADGGLLYI
jgi:hypothetical protein